MTSGPDNASDGYRAIGEWYDAEHDPIVDDVALYLQLAEIVGDPILELGCGSGRILAPLVQAGHDVTGVDRSAPMLERARARLGTTTATLVLAEMDRLPADLAARHGLVILSHNTLLHATTPEAQRSVLTAAKAALDPRGMLVLDVVNPVADLAPAGDGRVTIEGRWQTGDGGSVAKFSTRSVDQATQLVVTDIWYDHVDARGVVSRSATRLELRYVTAAELLLQLELSGFVEPQLYGTYDLDPYAEDSPRILVTAEATPSRRPGARPVAGTMTHAGRTG